MRRLWPPFCMSFFFSFDTSSMIKTMKNNSDIQIIFTDIDWTLLNHGHDKHEFDTPSIEALKKVQKQGVKVFLCTARPFHSVKGTGILDIIKPDGVICTNGAVAYVGEQIIHNHIFPNHLVEEIVRTCHKHHITVELSDEKDRWLTKGGNRYVDEYFAIFNEVYPDIRKYKGENISAILLMCPEKFDEKLKEELPKECSLFRFAPTGIDLHLQPIYKSEVVNAVLDYLKIDRKHAMAIGDDYGDIKMFEVVGHPICMGNGREEVKPYAEYICPHIDEHGVSIALNKYFKI